MKLEDISNVEGSQGLAGIPRYAPGEIPLPTEEQYAKSTYTPTARTTSTLSAAFVSRGANLGANLGEGMGRALDYVNTSLGGQPKYEKGLTSLRSWVDGLKDYSKNLGYQPEYKVTDVTKDPTKFVPFFLERLAGSVPDMAALAHPGLWSSYYTSRTNEILNDTLRNDGRTFKDATVGDVARAAGVALAVTSIGAYTTRRLTSPSTVSPGVPLPQRVANEAKIQSVGEGMENLLELLGTHVGTKKGLSNDEAQQSIVEGFLVGHPLGATAQGIKEAANLSQAPTTPPVPTPTPQQLEQEIPQEQQAQPETQPETQPEVQQAGEVHPEVANLMQNFGLTEDEANAVLNEQAQQEQQAPIQQEAQPVQTEQQTQPQAPDLHNAVQTAVQQSDLNAQILGLDETSAADLKRINVHNAIVEQGLPLSDARELTKQLEENNFANLIDRLDLGRTEPNVRAPGNKPMVGTEPTVRGPESAQQQPTGEVSQPRQLDLGRNIPNAPVDTTGSQPQYNSLEELANAQKIPFNPLSTPKSAPQAAPIQPEPPPIEQQLPPELKPAEEVPPLKQKGPSPIMGPSLDFGANIEPKPAPEDNLLAQAAPIEPAQAAPQVQPAVAPAPTIDLGKNIPSTKEAQVKPKEEKPKTPRKPKKSIEDLRREKAEYDADLVDRKQRMAALSKIQKFLNKTLDPDAFPNAETAYFAGKSLLAHKKGFLDIVQSIANTPKYKGNEVGRAANRILNNLTESERAEVKSRAKDFLRDKDLTKLSLDVGVEINDTHNPEVENFKNATQGLNWFLENGKEAERYFAKKLLPHVRGVEIQFVDDVAKKVDVEVPKGYKAPGAYKETDDNRRIIYLDENIGTNNVTFLHEAFHAGTMNKLNKYYKALENKQPVDATVAKSVKILEQALKDVRRRIDKTPALEFQARYNLSKAAAAKMLTDVHELVSYGLTSPQIKNLLMDTKSGSSKIWNRIRDAFKILFGVTPKFSAAFNDVVDGTDIILDTEPEHQISIPDLHAMMKVSKNIQTDINKLKAAHSSRSMVSTIFNMAKTGHNFETYKNALNSRLDGFSEASLRNFLAFLQNDDIIRWKGDDIKPLARLEDLSRKVGGMRTRLHGKANLLAEDLARYINKNGNNVLSNAMHIARLQEIKFSKHKDLNDALQNDWVMKKNDKILNDPTATQAEKLTASKEISSRTTNLKHAYAFWSALGKQQGGHDMYRKVNNYYSSYLAARRHYLNERLLNANLGASATQKLMSEIRLMYENAAKNSGDYFPFMRHGKYWMRIKSGPRDVTGFYTFDSIHDRNAFLDKVASHNNLDKNDSDIFSVGITDEKSFDFVRQSSQMVKDMFGVIDNSTAKNKAELKDEIFQTYLDTMPEASMRKHFMHPDKVTGFSGDVLRNFKTYSMKAGNEIARLSYNDRIENEISSAYSFLDGMPTFEQAKSRVFVDEMALRAREELNPRQENAIVNKINQFTFLWLLTSASSAAIQMTSVPGMVMPTLSSRYGTLKAASKFLKYSNIFKSLSTRVETHPDGTKEIIWPSIKDSKIAKANPMLAKAMREAADDYDLFQSTNVSVLTDRTKTPEKVSDSAIARASKKTYNIMTAMFSGSERISREMSFGMIFEMEYDKTKDYDKSKQLAIKYVDELLGRYDNANRPRVFRNALMKNIGQFKQYSIVMTSFWVRNMYNVLKGEDYATRKFALERMTGVVLFGALLHGFMQTPLYSATTLLIDAILNVDDDEVKRRAKENPRTAESSDLRFRYSYLPKLMGDVTIPNISGRAIPLNQVLERGPISSLTDMNFGAKTSQDVIGLWFRDSKPGNTWAETAQNMMIANLGPTASSSLNIIGGMEDLNDGNVIRGLEKIAPAFIKGLPMSYRLATEGAESKAEKDILKREEIDTINLIAATTGLQPTRLTRLQDRNFKYAAEAAKIDKERDKLLNKLNRAMYDEDNPDKTNVKEAFEKITEFNQRYPTEDFLITMDSIERSVENYANDKAKTYRGLRVSDEALPYMAKIIRMSEPHK